MSLVIEQSQPVPLTADNDGVIRVAGTRVTLDSVVQQFRNGSTAEQIQEDFPSLALRDIYAAIAYYLGHRELVEDYLATQARAAIETRREIESDSTELRRRLSQLRKQTRG